MHIDHLCLDISICVYIIYHRKLHAEKYFLHIRYTSRCVYTGYDAIGSYKKELESYSGAIGALQKGEIGFLQMPVYIPLIDPGKNFTYSPTLYEDTMTMLSGYRTVNTSHSGDIFTMFAQVGVLVDS